MISFLFPGLAALALVRSTLAVTLIASSLPACVQQCAILQQAQQGCVPPPNGAAAVSNQATYNSCFCQSAYLVPLNGPNAQGVCTACAPSDTTTLQSWFSGFCKQGAVAGDANANGQSTTSTTSTPTKANTPTATASGANARGGAQQSTANEHKSWVSTHARWVVMLVVLFVGLSAFAFIVWYFHRRHQRKQELGDHSRAPGVQPDMNTWGPGQSVHEFRAPGETTAAAATAEKGKERAEPQEPAPKSKRGSRLLKKPWV